MENRKELIAEYSRDRIMAHELIFRHRHKNETPEFHAEMINLWHDPNIMNLAIQAFRGGAKSTVGCEEATIIKAILGEFKNGIIVGEKYERAVERLTSIKYELENNEVINAIFGNQIGGTWSENKIELTNGTIIQAYGRGQSMRGAKHHDQRPDYVVGDDIEDMESVKTEDAKRATLAWFMSVLVPALDRNAVKRVIGTPLETDSLMERLEEDEGWTSRKFPIESVDQNNERVATWPNRFPINEIDTIKKNFQRMGMLLEFGREYMCQARSGETRQFTREHLKILPEVRKWHGVYAMYDPARSVNKNSAHTGKAVWSWIGNRLVVWEASGHFWRPDEIVNDMFVVNEKYNPVTIGVEEDGLNEFIMQPIRQEMTKRDDLLPIRPMKAPKGKLDFIRSLQPFFMSGEATMAAPAPDLVEQLLNFPVGRMDVPNALAYALKMRPGLPVYEDFCGDHIESADDLPPHGRYVCAANYHAGALTGLIYQKTKNQTRIIADNVFEGDPQQRAAYLIEWALYEAGGQSKLDMVVHPDHFERYSGSGFVGALRKMGCDPRRGGEAVKGRGLIVDRLRSRKQGMPEMIISEKAKWTLNGFAGGYCFEFRKGSSGLTDRAPEGLYRTLFEGFESACALSAAANTEEDKTLNYAYTATGQRYLSSRPQ
jgi:hypothetical protein